MPTRSRALAAATSVFLLLTLNCFRKPNTLEGVIREQQDEYVRDSYGEAANECFTWVDLADFEKRNIPVTIVASLRKDRNFLQIVETIRALQPAARQELFVRSADLCKPTWAQLGRIDIEGQTDAGQKAQLMIAEAITQLARELSARPPAAK